MSEERYLVFPLYLGVGLCNQWLSLSVAVVLAHWTRRTLVLDLGEHATQAEADRLRFAHSGQYLSTPLTILDLLDVPVPVLCHRDADEQRHWLACASSSLFTTPEHWPSCLLDSVLVHSDGAQTHLGQLPEPADLTRFAHGRTQRVYLSDLTDRSERVVRWRRPRPPPQDPPSYAFAQPLSWCYTRCPRRRQELAQLVARVRPKACWQRIAHDVLRQQWGTHSPDVDVLHWRRTDKLSCLPSLPVDEWLRHMDRACPRESASGPQHRPLAIVTDAPHDPFLVALQAQRPCWLVETAVARHRPSDVVWDHLSQALVSLVIASEVTGQFVGSPNSTFTSCIHQLRGQQRRSSSSQQVLWQAYPQPEPTLSLSSPDGSTTCPSWVRWQRAPKAIGFETVHPEVWQWLDWEGALASVSPHSHP